MKTLKTCSLLFLFLSGCENSNNTIRHGNLSYNAAEVFRDNSLTLSLAKAAGRGDVKEVNRLVAAGAKINDVGGYHITPLWWALWAKDFEGFEALLDDGANPNAQRPEGFPIMCLAADMDDSRFLAAALKHGGDPNLRDSQSGETPIFRAVLNGYTAQIDLLLAAKADLNAQDPISHWTLPMVAIGSRADYQLAYRFLENGSNPMLKTSNGRTLVDIINTTSINASNNGDPWREKTLELLRSKGVKATN